MSNIVRELVSKNKNRFVCESFNLVSSKCQKVIENQPLCDFDVSGLVVYYTERDCHGVSSLWIRSLLQK